MGNIKKIRKKYQKPSHPWQKERIVRENEYFREYGFKNKTEMWRAASLLDNFKTVAKECISTHTKQSEKEAEQLLSRLRKLGLLSETSMLNDILTLTEKDIMERRLQTIVFRRGIARTAKQARQFITHNHIKVSGVKISSPSYLVMKQEEDKITYAENSSLFSAEHPERVKVAKPASAVPPKVLDKNKKDSRGRMTRKKDAFQGRKRM